MRDEAQRPEPGDALLDALADWLMARALDSAELEEIFDGCCERLRAAGVPLRRVFMSFRTLHPLFRSMSITWQRGADVSSMGHLYESETDPAWRRSPFFHMLERSVPLVRRRLAGPEKLTDFLLLEELAAEGDTDYLAHAINFRSQSKEDVPYGIIVSWTTDRENGFSEWDIRAILRIQKRLAVACKVAIEEQITSNILATYLGRDAGDQVLGGRIRKGDGETVHAVIWFSDLRGSTEMADVMPSADYLALLNAYFECSAGAVIDQGGEVLDFIGDGVLAIFRIAKGVATPRRACKRALAAAADARGRLARLNETRAQAGAPSIEFGIGLHIGDVVFGNIGVGDRLSFSVIGPAANEAERLEALTKTLEEPVLVSGEFAALVRKRLRSLGRHRLRGVGEPLEVLAPPAPG